MKTWISLLRGINVGGNNILPMKDLRALLEQLKFKNVRTYIQSGNCVFEADETTPSKISSKVSNAIKKKFGFELYVLTISGTELKKAVKTNPFRHAEDDPKSVHFYFLSETAAKADIDALSALRMPSEDFKLTKSVFYFSAPDGIGRSKLAAQAERKLGVKATGRNYNTVRKLIELID